MTATDQTPPGGQSNGSGGAVLSDGATLSDGAVLSDGATRATESARTTESAQPIEPVTRRHRSQRKSALSPAQSNQIFALSVLGVLLATFASTAAPTGHGVIDAVYRSAFVLLTILGASRARRWSLVIAAGLTTIGSTTLMLIPPVGAFAVAGILAWQNKRDRVLGAMVGLLVGWSALNLVWPTTTGATALLAAVAVVPLWISGYRVARSKTRRRIRLGALACLVVAFAGIAITGVVVLTQRNVLSTAADDTVDAAKGMTAASTEDSAKRFSDAAERFDSAASFAGAIWTFPARLVPVVSQNLDAVHQAASSGADVTRTAAEIAGSVDYDKLQLDGGGIDLAVLASFETPVEQAEAVITSVDERITGLDSPWILGPLQDKLDAFGAQTGPLRNASEIASLAVNQLPGMLGADGQRRYLMLLGNPAEARDIGGHIGTFAELTATNGILKVERVDGPYQLFGPGSTDRPQLTNPNALPPAMLEMNPTRFPQNWGTSPDLDAVASAAGQLYPQSAGGAPLDGVFYADPYAFAAVLNLVGPIGVTVGDGTSTAPVEVTADNAVSFLTRDQFVFGESGEDPTKELVKTALDRLTGDRLPAISAMVDSFGPVIEEGRLQLVTFHDDDSELLQRTGLDQPFVQPKGGDLLAVVDRNGFPSKIDAYLQRSINYRLSWDPASGAVGAQVEIALTNNAPAEGLPPLVSRSPEGTAPGTNRTVLAVITPFDAVDATLDGEMLPIGTRPEQGDLKRHSFLVDLPPGSTKTVILDLNGSVKPGPDYRLRYYNQPLVNSDDSEVTIRSLGKPFIGGVTAGTVRISNGSGGGGESGQPTKGTSALRITDLRLRTEP